MMVKNLLAGNTGFIKQLQMVGFRFDNMLDEVSAGTANSIDGHEVVSHSVWRWSCLSASPEGVGAWWSQIDNLLVTMPDPNRHVMLMDVFGQAVDAVSFTGNKTFKSFARVWDESEKWFTHAPGWDEKVRNQLVFTGLLKGLDYATPVLDQLWETNRWTAEQFSSAAFSLAWDSLLARSTTDLGPVLLESLIKKTPSIEPLGLQLPTVTAPYQRSALPLMWERWIDEHNRPQSQSMENESFQRLTKVLEVLLAHTVQVPATLDKDMQDNMVMLKKNVQWSSLVSAIEKSRLNRLVGVSVKTKSSTNRL